MIPTIRTTALGLAATGLILGSVTSATAGARHEFYKESFHGKFHLSAKENPCGRWGATVHEDRVGGAKILTPPGGRVRGEYHINGAVDGEIKLVPDNASRPTYSGSYREKFNAVITVDNDGNERERVSQYRLRAPLAGSDGSHLVLRLGGKVTVNGKGRLVVQRDIFGCD